MLKSWNASIQCVEKIDFLLSMHSFAIEGKLRQQLLELNNLRNWIAHGFPYKTVWLIEPDKQDKTTGTVLDYEDSVDWAKKFPATKFSSLNELNKKDAEIATRIVLEVLIKLATVHKQPFSILTTYNNKINYQTIFIGSSVDDLIKLENFR